MSCSPGLANTGIIPSNFFTKFFLTKAFYTSDAASYSAFVGLFTRGLKGGEYVHNSPSIFFDTSAGKFIQKLWDSETSPMLLLKLKPIVMGVAFIFQSVYQQMKYKEVQFSAPNKICADGGETASKLYDWSLLEVHKVHK